jgi:hypothetical protein
MCEAHTLSEMNTRVLAVLATIFVLAACDTGPVGTDTSPSADVSVVASASRQPAPSPTESPLPVDPCHVAGVTYCALNPAVTQATIGATICVSGWTATVRPPSSYTSPLKLQQIAAEHLADTKPADYEEDHRVPLELGGAPSDPFNLSPEAHPGSFAKDGAENAGKADVCGGRATLQAEQVAFIAAWLAPYPGYLK